MPVIDKSTEVQNMKEEKFVLFKLENRNYGLDIKYVNHIMGCMNIKKADGLPDYFEGIMEYGNKKLPVIDLRKKFCNNKSELSKESYVIVSMINGNNIGLLVNSISEVIYLNKNDIKPVGEAKSIFGSKSIKGISIKNNITSFLVDIEKILNEKDYRIIEKFN